MKRDELFTLVTERILTGNRRTLAAGVREVLNALITDAFIKEDIDTTNDLTEGNVRLYYTDARVKTFADGVYRKLADDVSFNDISDTPTTLAGYGVDLGQEIHSGTETVSLLADDEFGLWDSFNNEFKKIKFSFLRAEVKSYTDAFYLQLAGGTLTGPLVLSADPTQPLEATTKKYVDDRVNGLNWKHSVNAATVAPLPAYTVSGGGTILTADINGAFPTTDTVSLVDGDSVLVKNEAGALKTNHGSFKLVDGDGSNPWVLTRTEDANTSETLEAATWFIIDGAVEKTRIYSINVTPIVLTVTELTLALTGGIVADLTGDVTSVGSVTTISGNAVTFAKMQAITTNRLLGSGTSGTDIKEILLGTNLSFTGNTLNAVASVNLGNSDLTVTAATNRVLNFPQFLTFNSTGVGTFIINGDTDINGTMGFTGTTNQNGSYLFRNTAGSITHGGFSNSTGVFFFGGAATVGVRVGIEGTGSTSGTTALSVQNSSGLVALRVTDDGKVNVGALAAVGATLSVACDEPSANAISVTDATGTVMNIGKVGSGNGKLHIFRNGGIDAVILNAIDDCTFTMVNGAVAIGPWGNAGTAPLCIRPHWASDNSLLLTMQDRNNINSHRFLTETDNNSLTFYDWGTANIQHHIGTDNITYFFGATAGEFSIGHNSGLGATLGVKGEGNTVGTVAFHVENLSGTDALRIFDDQSALFGGSLAIGGGSLPSTGAGIIAVATSSVPATNVADQFTIYGSDIVAGNRAFHVKNENGEVVKLYKFAAMTAADSTATDATIGTADQLINNMRIRINELETRLQAFGLAA